MTAADEGQVDLHGSKARSVGMVGIGLAFVAGSLAYLRWAPDGSGSGSFAEFAMYGGVALGAAGIVGGLYGLVTGGLVVSVGPRGIFDRRLSTDWVPWGAIASLTSATIHSNRFLMLELDPAHEAGLPLKPRARTMARLNAGIGFKGYGVSATTLEGGFDALADAVRRHAPAADRTGAMA